MQFLNDNVDYKGEMISASEAWDRWFAAQGGDGYGEAVFHYAKRWAEQMEARIDAGEKLEAVAKEESHKADTEGITGFMYGTAVSALAHLWVHGEALRRWHNLDIQTKNEGELANETGGVLNPATLSIG